MYYGLEGLDRKIAERLVEASGTFVELGAGDGFKHSNTLVFEKRGWRGVLIEPIPAQYERCVLNRPLARVFNCACVPPGKEGAIEMTSVGYMSMVVGAMGGGERETEWIARGAQRHGEPARITVSARTLTSILKEAAVEEIDLLVLDVEGYEVEVMKGLDLRSTAPRWIVAEDSYNDDLLNYLLPRGYLSEAVLSERTFTRDTLYRRC
jgi:FkbM family methyltransferase